MQKYWLTDGYKIPGHRAYEKVAGLPNNPQARVIKFKRLQKKRNVLNAGRLIKVFMTEKYSESETCPVGISLSILNLNVEEFYAK